MWVELGRGKSRGGLEDFVGPAQLAHLAAQQLLAFAGIGFGLAHPFAQRLGWNAEIAGYVGGRAAGLKDEAGASVKQLLGVLPLSWHGCGESPFPRTRSWFRSLRETRPGSDQLSHFREEYNLVLDAIALGYWIRQAEPELADGLNTFDANYIADLREKFAASDEPDTILTIAMNQVREGLPEPFAQGPGAWSEVVEVAIHVLTIRGRSLLAEQPDFDEGGEISDEQREFALSLGYGLAMAVDALGIDGTRTRQR